jgi:drug/metabolite transporter (DMT)-like permease
MKLTRSHALFAAICLIWGATWIAVKVGIEAVPPIAFAGTRFTVAGSILLGALWWQGTTSRVARADLPRFAAVTLLMVVATYTLLFWGAQFVSSGLAAILDLAFLPVALLAIGALLGEERFSRARAMGVALGVAGLLVLFGPKTLDGGGHGGGAVGSALWFAAGGAIVLSAFVYSLGSVLARPLLRAYPPALVSGATTLGGGLVLVAGALALEPGASAALSFRWGGAAWASWAFLVLFGSLVAYTAYLRLVREWGASGAGSYAFVSPIIAVGLGVLAFGEDVTRTDAVGMAIMIAGAWLTLRPAEPGDAAAPSAAASRAARRPAASPPPSSAEKRATCMA